MQRFETESVFLLPGFAEPSNSGSAETVAPQRQRHASARAAGVVIQPSTSTASSGMEDLVPWSAVEEALAMSRGALAAKQQFAEVMQAEADKLKAESGAQKEVWTKRAQRAEIDSGSLLEQLETLIQAKSALASDREELGRGIGLLRAERELLCEQLQVDPSSANLCREVNAALVEARRAGVLEAQLRVLVRQRRQLRLELEAARDAHTRHWAEWQAREEAYRSALEAAGVPQPDLPPAPGAVATLPEAAAASSPPGAAPHARGSCGGGSSGSCCDTVGEGTCCGAGGGASSSLESSLVDASGSHPLFSPQGPASPIPTRVRGFCPQGAASGRLNRWRSLSVDAGVDAAMEQAGLEAALEQLVAHGSDSGVLADDDDADDAELAALMEDAAAEAAAAAADCCGGGPSASPRAAGAAAVLPTQEGPQQYQQKGHQQHGTEAQEDCIGGQEGSRRSRMPAAWQPGIKRVAALG